jgi:hypothetical protein
VGGGNYHGAQLAVRKRFSGGDSIDLNYTFSKSIDLRSNTERVGSSTGVLWNPWQPGLMKGVSDYDNTHLLSMQGVYGLPFGKGTLLVGNANALEDALIGGWKLDPIWISSSGFRANVGCQGTLGGQASNATGQFTGAWFQTGSTAWACDAPLVKGVNPYAPSSYDQPRTKVTGYWNATAFTAPLNPVTVNGQQDFTPWGVRGDQITGPGWYSFDVAAHKQLKINETLQLEVGAMALNALNHVHLNNPSTSGYIAPTETITGGFGTITGDASNNGSGRVWQFDAKLFF